MKNIEKIIAILLGATVLQIVAIVITVQNQLLNFILFLSTVILVCTIAILSGMLFMLKEMRQDTLPKHAEIENL